MKDTIVTAIYHYSYMSRMGGRNYNFKYYENPFTNLLNLEMNIIVFSHDSEINDIKSFFNRNNFDDFIIINYDLNDYRFSNRIYTLKENKGIIDSNGLINGNSMTLNDRNVHLCLSKIEFLKIAINGCYFESNDYYWFDAGLFHNGIIPNSFGGMEKYVDPVKNTFWPLNQNNICNPHLIKNLKKHIDQKLLFLGLTSFSQPQWWNQILPENKQIHIIGGIFGGDKLEILNIYTQFQSLITQVFSIDELTLEEDILSIIITNNNYKYLKFDTWYHDIPLDLCYYQITSDTNCFYKIFI